MNILVIYATIEGQTGKIARFVSEQIAKLGHTAQLIDANAPTEISFDQAEAVILAAPVHERRHPQNFEALLSAHAEDLSAKKVLFLSISLSAAFPEGIEEAGEYVTEMKMRTGLEPEQEMLVGGAVRLDHYDYFAMQVLQHVVLRNKNYDPSEGTNEFTDWDALSSNIAEFLS